MPPRFYISRRRSILVFLVFALAASQAPAQSPTGQDLTAPGNRQPPHPDPLRTLTTLRAAHGLSDGEARRGYPIHVRATVTYYDRYLDSRRIAFFLHDATGSIYAAAAVGTTFPGRAPLPGTIVDVTGVSAPGDFAPIIDQARITVVGTSQIPAHAKPVTLPHLLTGTEDGQWVEIEGVVHSVFESSTNVTLQIGMADGIISATAVRAPGVEYQHLVDDWVHIRGNAAPIFNSNHQMTGGRLFFPGLETITAVAPDAGGVFARPVQPVSGLLRFNPARAWPHRVHVHGAVTLNWPGRTICIKDSTEGLCARTAQTDPVPAGSLVDLAGFITLLGFKPVLQDAVFRPLPDNESVAAAFITPEQALSGDRDSELVQLDGRLIGRDLAASETTLILSSRKSVFRAILPSALTNSSVSAIPIGSNLRITGICSVEVDAEGTLKGYGFTQASRFWIMLPSSQDVVILSTPSWWTSARITFALLVSLAITIAGFVWVIVLRRRVEQSTRELRDSRELYRHMAHHDALTGLPTRALLHDRLQIALARARRFHKSIALLMLDLDRFKQINDSFGHAGGDHVLQITAERLTATIRQTDSVARMGGDEFIILLTDLDDDIQAERIAEKVVTNLSVPILIGKLHVPVSVSVGICSISDEDVEADVLLQRVDAAMYRAKTRGRSCFQTFNAEMVTSTHSQLQIQLALDHAIERREFELHYQPVINCSARQLSGFEALLRWRNPELGLLMPAEFISLAEESGLILPIGEWVIHEACREIGLLERQLNRSVDFSVNISPIQFLHHDLPNLIARTLKQTGRDPSTLHIEITENNFLDDSLATHHALDQIRALGVQLVLDDFGVGFSTLSYIARFPLDWIKLDQSLVRNCTTDRGSLTVIRAILEMARGLDIRVVAEGIESVDQYALLAKQGCDAAQGFYFSRAVPAAQLPTLIASLEETCRTMPEWINS